MAKMVSHPMVEFDGWGGNIRVPLSIASQFITQGLAGVAVLEARIVKLVVVAIDAVHGVLDLC
jgi:hypothetical protein